MKKSFAPLIILVVVIAIFGILAILLSQNRGKSPTTTPAKSQTQQTARPQTQATPSTVVYSSSAKGIIQVENPSADQEITSPLTVTGFVYGNNGKLTIKLKQTQSGVYVTEDKTISISGSADQITFAETIQFGLPAMPQAGILEVVYKDASGQGLDDSVSIEVNFPTDLGSGL